MQNDSDTKRLAQALEEIQKHPLLRIYTSPLKMMWANFLRGLAFGLGSVIGATLLVYVLILLLAQVEFIPLIGDWAVELINQIESRR